MRPNLGREGRDPEELGQCPNFHRFFFLRLPLSDIVICYRIFHDLKFPVLLISYQVLISGEIDIAGTGSCSCHVSCHVGHLFEVPEAEEQHYFR